jgi:D-alanyl-D-alanine carboxypeptidase
MKNRILIFALIGAALIFLFLVFQKNMGNVFFSVLREKDYSRLAAIRNDILAEKYQDALPLQKHEITDLELGARAAISLRINKDGQEKILFEKNADEKLPIASLTKLMSALVALENIDLGRAVVFSKVAASQEGEANYFHQAEIFYARDLIYSSLLESSNRAVQALAEVVGEKKFVELMNEKAKELGMENTLFFNPTGLDPEPWSSWPHNFSTASDLAILSQELFKIDLIREIAQTKEKDIYQIGVGFHHRMINTNEFLGEVPDIILSKTGQTPLAEKCLIIGVKSPNSDGYVINIILGSSDHFGEMRKMIEWIKNAYRW